MDFVEQVRSSVDIVAEVSRYVKLRRLGGGQRYVGLCPFHTEKTPSFNVHGNHQFYKCFGCGAGGDVFKFVMEMERITFWEALRLLAERNGVPLPQRPQYSDPETKLRAAVYRAHELAQEVFVAALRAAGGVVAREYLRGRGLEETAISQFGLGYAEPSGNGVLRRLEREGFSAAELEASGLVVKRQDGSFFDRFRNRLMFPIHNESGKVIAFAGRALSAEDEPKYLNSPETPIYRKSFVLYNLHRAKEAIRKQDRSVLVEGYMDVIGAVAAGVEEAVASCGTALTAQQVKSLKRHSRHIVVNFDPDGAGSRAAERSIETLLEEDLEVRILQLDGGLDPDEYVRQRGSEAYQRRIQQAPGYFYWLADRARERFDLRTPEGRIAAFQFLFPAIQRISGRVERLAVANDLAAYLGVEAGVVLDQLRRAALERRPQALVAAPLELRGVEKLLLRGILENPTHHEEALGQLASLQCWRSFTSRRIVEAMLAMHRAGEDLTYAALDGRLADQDKILLASITLTTEHNEDPISADQLLACLAALAAEDLAQERQRLRKEIKDAERRGDLQAALELMADYQRLERGSAAGS